MRRTRRTFLGAAVIALSLVLSACQSGGDDNAGDDSGKKESKGTITVGVSAAFAENQIVAEMYAQVLEHHGYTVKKQLSIDSREISQPSLEKGEIDVKPEYLGSLLTFVGKDSGATASSDADKNAEAIDKILEAKGLKLLDHSEANDTNAIVVTRKTADAKKLAKVSDLTSIAGQLTFGGPPECPSRPFCIPGLKEKYGIEFKSFKPLDVGGPLTVAALEGDEVDVALLFSTSSVISKKGFVVLEDDKALQTAENIAPVCNPKKVDEEAQQLLNDVSEKLTTSNITALNAEVEIDKKDPADVAKAFLEKEGLLD